MIPESAPPAPETDQDRVRRRRGQNRALKPAIIDAISTVYDPEIPVNIWELGLIYDVAVDADGVALITMTLTAPGCPAAQSLPSEVGAKVEGGRRRHRRESRRRVGTGVDEGSHVRGGEAAARALVNTMLRLSKKSDYALMAMKHLATRTDLASASAREIAEQYDIPVELMAKVLQRLARRGLLTSHQGTRGGYRLARAPSAISVADIIQAIDGPLTVTACSTEAENCGQYAKCSVRDPLWRIKDRILVGAGDLFAPGSLDRTAGRGACGADGVHQARALIMAAAGLSRFPRHDPGRPAGARGDAAVFQRAVRQSGQPAARLRLGSAEGGRHRARRRSRRSSAPARPRSCSPAAPANRTTSRSKGRSTRGAIAAITSSPRQPSTSRCSTPAPASRREGCRVTRLGVDSRRIHRSRRAARGDHRPHGAHLDHGGQQRDRRAAAARRDRRDRAGARRALSHRCGAGRRQGSARRRAIGDRSAVADRAQVLRAQRAPARSTCGAASRSSSCTCQIDGGGHENGLRSGTLNVPGSSASAARAEFCRDEMPRRVRAAVGAARSAVRRAAAGPRRRAAERAARRSAAAAQPPRQLRRHRRGGAADGARRSRRLDRIRVQLRQPGAVARAAGDRRRRRSRRRVHPLRPRPPHHRRRHRLRHRSRHDRRPRAAQRLDVESRERPRCTVTMP